MKVNTGCSSFGVDTSKSMLRINLVSDPVNGRANSELVSRLSEILGCNVGILSGHKSRRKKLVADIDKNKVESILSGYYE